MPPPFYLTAEVDGRSPQDYVLEKKSRDFAHGFVRRITAALGCQLEYSDDAHRTTTDNLIANGYRAASLKVWLQAPLFTK